MDRLAIRALVRLCYFLLLLLCAYVILLLKPFWQPFVSTFLKVLSPFFIAAILAYLLHPLVEKMKENGIPRPIAILIIYLVLGVLLAYLFIKGTPYLVQEMKDLINNIPAFANTYRQLVHDFYERTSMLPDGFRVTIEEGLAYIELVAAEGLMFAITNISGIVNSLLMLIIIPFLVFYILKDIHLIEKSAWYMTPRKWRKSGRKLLKNINISLGNYIRGQLLVCLVVGLIATLGLWLIGMPYAVLLGIFIGVSNIIPYFGPVIGVIPVIIIAITVSVRLLLLGLAINFTIQLIEGNLLSPLIVGKSLHMHPVLIMFALLVGAEVGGILGLVLSVPILAVIKAVLLHVRGQIKGATEEA